MIRLLLACVCKVPQHSPCVDPYHKLISILSTNQLRQMIGFYYRRKLRATKLK